MKKGMSSLVGVVLLIGIVVVVAIFLLNFFDVFSQDQADNIENDSLEREYCDNSPIALDSICSFDDAGPSPDPGLKVKLKNEGSIDIASINLTLYDIDSGYDTGQLDFGGIVKYGSLRQIYNDVMHGDDFDKLTFIKHLVTDAGIEITCEAMVLELNPYPTIC